MIHYRKIYFNSGKFAFIVETFVPCAKSAFLEAQAEHEKPIHTAVVNLQNFTILQIMVQQLNVDNYPNAI
jgi:hypothetical protein